MGRRKIEIQPITHERNRSVTFLKRKNGLFKKAYELGVLCSVDVAVIIFEERPGHHVKLYQYCSTDVQGMVQRHLRFDGEKDTRTPVDFANNKAHEEPADDDDDAEDDAANGAPQKKDTKSQLKPKLDHTHSNGASIGGVPIRPAQPTDVSHHGIDIDYRRMSNGTINGSGLPTSSERHSSRPSSGQPHTPTSGGLNLNTLSLGNGAGMGGLPVPVPLPIPPNKRPRLDELAAGLPYPYRLDVDLGTYPPTAMATSLAPQHAHGAGSPVHTQPQGGLSGLFGAGGFQGQQAQQGMDYRRNSMGYAGQQAYGGSPGMMPGRTGPTSTNMLEDFLRASSDAQANGNNGGGGFGGFDWPITGPNAAAQAEVPNNNDPTSWLDFLTNNAQPPNAAASPSTSSTGGGSGNGNGGGLGLPTPATSRTASNSVSSVSSSSRGHSRSHAHAHHPYANASAASSSDSLSLGRLSPGRKRTRDEGEFEDRLGMGGMMKMGMSGGMGMNMGMGMGMNGGMGMGMGEVGVEAERSMG